jgi:rRNA biogenesis protein RRP5
MKLWGMVLEVTPKALVVSLPQGLRGTVAPDEVRRAGAARAPAAGGGASAWRGRRQQRGPPLPPPAPHTIRPAIHAPTPQASDALRQMLDPDSKPGAALRKAFPGGRPPALPELFSIGQYVRCAVIGLGGGDDDAGGRRGRVQLSLRLKKLCEGLGADALASGRCVPAVVRTAEDHVYTLGFGIKVQTRRRLEGGGRPRWRRRTHFFAAGGVPARLHHGPARRGRRAQAVGSSGR